MSTTSRIPFSPRPVHGTCRWVNRRHHVLRINGTRYTFVRVGGSYRLLNWDNGNVYAIDVGGRWCTCPSFIWDHCPVQAGGDGRCKHIAALRKLGVLPDPGRPGPASAAAPEKEVARGTGKRPVA
jgi:hypothetical protein